MLRVHGMSMQPVTPLLDLTPTWQMSKSSAWVSEGSFIGLMRCSTPLPSLPVSSTLTAEQGSESEAPGPLPVVKRML